MHVADELDDVLALEATCRARRSGAAVGHALGGHEGIRFAAKSVAELLRSPDEELALFVLTATVPGAKRREIGVLGGT